MKKILKICLVTFIILLNNATVLAQEKELKFEKGNITFDNFNSMLEPNAAFVLIKTDYKDLTFSSNINKDGKIKELPSLDFSNNRIFAIETEKQKFIIKKKGYKNLIILIPKLYTSEKIEFIIK